MKITWASNAPHAPTGYGTQTRQMVKRLLADGHEVAIAANYGGGARVQSDPEFGIPVYGLAADSYGNDVLMAHHADFGGDWLITLYDTWVYKGEQYRGNIASWAPIDHYPVPPEVMAWCRQHPVIAMSRFGEAALREQGIQPFYAPHGIELDTFKPTPSNFRETHDIPADAFLVVINAANKGNMPPRKAWSEMLSALAPFMRDRPDAYVYIHTEQRGVYHGVDLIPLCMTLAGFGLDPARTRWPDQYRLITGRVTDEEMAAIYTAGDVLLATSMGEGFGIPVIEAQACGTPVIVTDFSAQPELVGAGWKVPHQLTWDVTQAAFLATPFVSHVYRALQASYEAKGTLRESAIGKAAEYDADKVYEEHWRPILAALADRLVAKPRAQRRAERRRRKAA